jgi:hypothetical protein
MSAKWRVHITTLEEEFHHSVQGCGADIIVPLV